VGKATKKCSALRDAEREGPNSNFDPLCQLAPAVNAGACSAVRHGGHALGALIDVIDAAVDEGDRALDPSGSVIRWDRALLETVAAGFLRTLPAMLARQSTSL